MYHFYRGSIKGSIKEEEYYILAKCACEAETRLLIQYDENSRHFGELFGIEIYSINANEYYGAIKYNKNIA